MNDAEYWVGLMKILRTAVERSDYVRLKPGEARMVLERLGERSGCADWRKAVEVLKRVEAMEAQDCQLDLQASARAILEALKEPGHGST